MDVLLPDRRQQAEAELQRHTGVNNSAPIVESLWTGLSTLRDLLLARFHDDVEAQYGIDSLLAPATTREAIRELQMAGQETDIYSAILASDEVRRNGYAKGEEEWFSQWLVQLRWGDDIRSTIERRISGYKELSDGDRRRMFASLVERALPEATKAPLIIYRLFPRSVRIATALAFDDKSRAAEIRNEQISFLPNIADCHECHGRPLANGETCRDCGNPLWKLRWMNAIE